MSQSDIDRRIANARDLVGEGLTLKEASKRAGVSLSEMNRRGIKSSGTRKGKRRSSDPEPATPDFALPQPGVPVGGPAPGRSSADSAPGRSSADSADTNSAGGYLQALMTPSAASRPPMPEDLAAYVAGEDRYDEVEWRDQYNPEGLRQTCAFDNRGYQWFAAHASKDPDTLALLCMAWDDRIRAAALANEASPPDSAAMAALRDPSTPPETSIETMTARPMQDNRWVWRNAATIRHCPPEILERCARNADEMAQKAGVTFDTAAKHDPARASNATASFIAELDSSVLGNPNTTDDTAELIAERDPTNDQVRRRATESPDFRAAARPKPKPAGAAPCLPLRESARPAVARLPVG